MVEAGDSITIEYSMSVPDSDTDGTVHTVNGTYTADGEKFQTDPTDITVDEGFFKGIVSSYNTDDDKDIDITELGQAASDYAQGDISITELGDVAAAYSNTSDN
jgi:hypothetical protein